MTLEEMYAEIDAIPGENGWWHSSTGEMFHELAKGMYGAGCKPEFALHVLQCAYGAAAEEFGS